MESFSLPFLDLTWASQYSSIVLCSIWIHLPRWIYKCGWLSNLFVRQSQKLIYVYNVHNVYYTACFFRSVMNQSQPTSLCSLSMSTCCLLPNYCHFFNSVFREESFLEEKTNQDNESLISPHSHSIVFCSHGPLKLVSGRRSWNKIKVTLLLCWVLKVFICYLCVSKLSTIYHCPGKQLT